MYVIYIYICSRIHIQKEYISIPSIDSWNISLSMNGGLKFFMVVNVGKFYQCPNGASIPERLLYGSRPVPTAALMSYAMSVLAVPMANPCRRTWGPPECRAVGPVGPFQGGS